MKISEAEKKALGVFTDWHVDEVTDRRRAHSYYGRRLLTRLRQAGVKLRLIDPPESTITTKISFEARILHNPDDPKNSSWEHLQDNDDADNCVICDTFEECSKEAREVIKSNADDEKEEPSDDLVIARVEVTYFKP